MLQGLDRADTLVEDLRHLFQREVTDDVQRDGSTWEVTAAPEHLTAVREALEGAGFTVENAELALIPKTTIEVDDESQAKKVLRLIDALEENDDVQEVYANFDISDEVMSATFDEELK